MPDRPVRHCDGYIQRFPFPRRRRYPPLRYNHVNRHPHRVLPVLLFRFYGGVSDGVFSSPAEQSFFNALINGSLRQGIYWTALISSITLLILTLYIGTHSILRMAGRIHPMTLPKRLALIGGWIITAVIFIASMIQSSISYDWYIRDYREEQRIRNDSLEHQRQLSYLEHEGWKVVRHKECGNNYVKSGEYYTGNRDVQYIDAWNFNRKWNMR